MSIEEGSWLDSDAWSGSHVYFRFVAAQDVTVLKFLTDGVLLREMMDDPLLTKYRYLLSFFFNIFGGMDFKCLHS